MIRGRGGAAGAGRTPWHLPPEHPRRSTPRGVPPAGASPAWHLPPGHRTGRPWHDPAVPAYAFEDFTPGRTFDLGTTVVDRDEMIAFAARFDPQPYHLDEQAGKESIFGGLAASGWFTAGLWMRAYVDAVLSDSTALGSPGGTEFGWPAPVFAGDELAGSLEVVDARLSRTRPGMGLVSLRGVMHRGDEPVFRIAFTGLYAPRDGSPGPA